MSSEPDPGQSLEQHPGSLADPSVPQRAGAIVTEVITSIADETRARADELHATAEADGQAEVNAARDASGKVRRCFDDLAGKLGELRSGIQQEEGLLSNSLGQLGSGRGAPAIPPPTANGPVDRERAEPVVDAEVVEDNATEEMAARVAPLQPDDSVKTELVRMSDSELGHTYVDALRLVHEREQAGTGPEQASSLVEAVLEEARTRPSFTDEESPARGLRARLASVAGRRMATPRERLREAVRDGASGSG